MELKVAITSGGTISKIDDVRYIGNFSSGETGANIAEEFLRRGHRVYYLHAKNARRPFQKDLYLDPQENLDSGLAKISQGHRVFHKYAERLREIAFETFEDYCQILEKTLRTEPIDVIVLAAAVSDYGVRAESGKISSKLDKLTLKMVKYPKVISLVKKWKPGIFQVGFKLLSRTTIDELIATGHRSGTSNHSDLTVANALVNGDFQNRTTVLITPEKTVSEISSGQLASTLCETVVFRLQSTSRH